MCDCCRLGTVFCGNPSFDPSCASALIGSDHPPHLPLPQMASCLSQGSSSPPSEHGRAPGFILQSPTSLGATTAVPGLMMAKQLRGNNGGVLGQEVGQRSGFSSFLCFGPVSGINT